MTFEFKTTNLTFSNYFITIIIICLILMSFFNFKPYKTKLTFDKKKKITFRVYNK